jgi:putative transposase
MPRRGRQAPGGYIYHVLNRAAGRRQLFDHDGDYEAFLRVLAEAQSRRPEPLPILAFCLMPNHWHLVPWPGRDGELSDFMFWLTMTHTQRWRHFRRSVGEGPLYQGRFKCFPVQAEGLDGGGHFLTLCRYVERNALRAGLVGRAENWPWSSLYARLHPASPAARLVRLHPWPVDEPQP